MLALFLMPVFRSPEDGAKHEVGPADLYSWSVSKGLNASNVNVLAKLHDGNLSAGEAKAHEKGWTLDEATVWLQNEQTGEYLHTVGATFKRDAGKHFHAYLAKQRPDIAFSAMEWKDLLLGNIADLGGLTVSYRAYQNALDGEDAPVLDGMTGEQRFFAGWGQIWRIKFRDEALRRQIVQGPHSPGRYRVLGTDGYGRSDSRRALRDFFEVDRRHIVLAALKSLAEEGSVDPKTVSDAMAKLDIDRDRPDPTGC